MKISMRLLFAIGSLLCAPISQAKNLTSPPTTTAYTVASGYWSDPGIWDGGEVPGAGTQVTISTETAVYINVDAIEVESILVNGTLSVINDPGLQGVHIITEYIYVSGPDARFEWGTPDEPWCGEEGGVITLVGGAPPAGTTPTTKGLMAMGGGTISIHGQYKESWTQLAKPAEPGNEDITVLGSVDQWSEGDEIVIASSAVYDYWGSTFTTDDTHLLESEVRTIANIDRMGTISRIYFNIPLNHNHFGEIQTYSNGGRTWDLDERAEVGLLTRCIRIEGDLSSEITHHGGHVMIMNGSYGYISGVEFYRMGQESLKARYPFHWHLCDDVNGQFINNCSLHHLYNRAVTVHGSQNAVVNDNVVFETQGHAMFFEDAVESGVEMNHNLVMNVRRPASLGAAFIHADRADDGIRVRGPGAFWITNPDNTFINNHAAAIQGVGFWYGMPSGPTGPSASNPLYTGVKPKEIPMGSFENNAVHGAYTGFHQDHSSANTSTGTAISAYETGITGWQTVKGLTAYGCFRGWWTRTSVNGIIFDETVLADSPGLGMSVTSFNGKTTNSLFVGYSGNGPFNNDYNTSAISLYDGYIRAYNCHFENFDQKYQAVFEYFGGTENKPSNFFSDCTFKNYRFFSPKFIPQQSSRLMSVIHDVDGQFTNAWGGICVYHPFFVDAANFSQQGNPLSYKTNAHFAALRVYNDINGYNAVPKTNPDAGVEYVEWGDGHCLHTDERLQRKAQIPVVMGLNRVYKIRMIEGVPSPLDLNLLHAMTNDQMDVQILDSPNQLSVNTAGYVNKSSEADVWSSTTNAWHWNSTNKILSIRMIAIGGGTGIEDKLDASALVRITGGIKSSGLGARESRPFGGTYRLENTKIEAEWFDYGGQNVAYYKSIPGELIHYIHQYPDMTNPGRNRFELMNGRMGELLRLYKSTNGSILAVRDLDINNYVKYTFNSPLGGSFPFKINYSSDLPASISIEINGVAAWSGSSQALAATTNDTTFSTLTLPNITLSKGGNVVKIISNQENLLIDWFSIGTSTTVPAPAPVFKKGEDIREELSADESYNILVYPNPIKDFLTIEPEISGGETFIMVLRDIKGAYLQTFKINGTTQIDMKPYGDGHYILQMYNAKGVMVKSTSVTLQKN